MSEDLEAISAAACMDVIARGEETINPKFAGVVRDLIDRLRLESSSSQSRLSEAVKVLEEIAQMPGVNGGHYDIGEEFRNTQSLRLNEQCRVLAKRFLATLGEET